MPLTTPIAASPQSNVFTERTTMVEVPGDSAPGPRAPARSSGRTTLDRSLNQGSAPAIARSDGTRAVVVEELFNTRVTGGILGPFSFDQYGDITPATVALYSVRNGKVVVDGVVRVPCRPDN